MDSLKKKYTPCTLVDDFNGDLITVNKKTYFGEIFNLQPKIGFINKNNIKITYLNMKNEECLIMSKHLLHRTDLSRTENFKGFNFRVIIKNNDGSINYNNKYKHTYKNSHHTYDETNKKLYGCKMFDFV